MKEIRFYGALLLAAFLAGHLGGKTDVAKLRPVEVIHVQIRATGITMETDTQDSGWGNTVQDALDNLRDTTAGEVFLETADFLIADQDALALVPELSGILRPNCRICVCGERVDLENAAAYLRVHKPGTTVREYLAGERNVSVLQFKEGKMTLVGQ